jgi:hypothetical protein
MPGFLSRFERLLERASNTEVDLIKVNAEPVQWRGRNVRWNMVLADLRGADRWSGLTLDDFRSLCKTVLPTLTYILGAAIDECTRSPKTGTAAELVGELGEVRCEVIALQVAGLADYEEAALTWQLTLGDDHGVTLSWLQDLCAAMSQLRSGTRGSANLMSFVGPIADVSATVDRLLSAVQRRLAQGPIQAVIVERLRTRLQNWGRKQLLDEMLASKTPEAVLQDRVDQFIFDQGLFPITHCPAAHGEVDTFVGKVHSCFGEAKRNAALPLVLELKQVVRDTSRTSLLAAIEHATGQAQIYAQHLRSNPEWMDSQVFCVIAYAGPQRYALPSRQDVVLVYLGESVPSQGAKDL